MQLGNGRWESTVFNSRLQPTQIALGTVQNGYDKLKLNYTYNTTGNADNNGNIQSQTITVPTVGANTGFVAVQNYNYDSLNRLKDATENVTPNGGLASQSWKQAFTFDRYGNRNFDEANTTTLPKNCGTSPNFVVCTADRNIYNPGINGDGKNRLNASNGYGFDNAGNTADDAQGRTFVYDAENKQISVSDPNGTIGQYFYDGDGKRVKKYVPSTGEVTIFVYDAAGKEIAEYSTIVAASQDAKVNYLTADHLGSPRVNTDQNGNVTARHDFHPFGEEIATSQRISGLGYGDDTVRKQFTGYERDNEIDLDFAQARYNNSQQGRFSSPDDFVNDTFVSDPQTWNLYLYVRNNPLRYSDPDGEERINLGDSEEKIKKDLEEARRKKKEIEKDKSLSKDERKKQLADQKATIKTFETKLEGTKVVNSILKALDKVGERNGLQLSDFELTTDGKNDFPALSEENRKILLGADAFTNVPGEGGTIFIRTETPEGFYRLSQTFPDFIYYGASGVAHEKYHRDNKGEIHSKAFERQKVVLKKFEKYYTNRAIYDLNLKFVEEGVNGKYDN
jgi:RHS repeat-associated protein